MQKKPKPVMIIFIIVMECIFAIYWLVYTFINAGKPELRWVGIFGTVASLVVVFFGIYIYFRRRKKEHSL